MRTSRSLALLVPVGLALASAAASGQRCAYFPDNAVTGGSNVIPFGHQSPTDATWSNQKYQTLIPAATLGTIPGLIAELAVVPATSGRRQFRSIKVQLAQTTQTALTTTFATNLGANPTTVLDARDYYWPSTMDTWTRIGFQKSFLFLPAQGNVVVDIEVQGAGMPDTTTAHAGCRSTSVVRMYAVGWTTTPPATGTLSTSAGLRMELCFDTNDARAFGLGCAGSNTSVPKLAYGGSAKLGNTLSIDLSAAIASRPVVLLLGITNAAPFPIDLTAAGAPGCRLYTSPDLITVTVTDASGAASIKLPIPNDSGLISLRFYNQFFPIDSQANRLGVSASNYGRALLGN
jgi:hypothetical protein